MNFSAKRWWGKNAGKLIGSAIAITGGAILWHTQAATIWEIYRTISLPFQPNAYSPAVVADSRSEQLEQELAETKAQNAQMKQLLESSTSKTTTVKPIALAKVIGRSADNWWQQIVIGKGTSDGVQIGSIALGDGGLVGRVSNVTAHTSQVLLATDPSSRIGALISRSRHMGYIQGNDDRSDRLVMQFFDKTPDVKIGDVVATSNVSQLFPGGLTVGKIVQIDLAKVPAPEAIVKLTAPINALEWVRIYPGQKAHLESLPTPQPSTVPASPATQK
jgi:rod shape-determining protein MreC